MSNSSLPLHASWERAWLGCGASTPGAEVRYALLARYVEPHRAYHTLQHLVECLDHFNAAAALAEHAAEVELALWFHDAIYNVRASDNEAHSAQWAVSALTAAGGSRECAARVEALIMATRHSAAPAGADAQVLVDIDLAILGVDEARFAEYEAQIRREYKHVLGILYRYKRNAILRAFLKRPFIYSTNYFRERYEDAARRNLRNALGENAA